MRRLIGELRNRGERGQTLLLFVAIFSVTLVLSAFAIDQGMWLGERRIAQKDADAAARAGAYVYLTDLDDFFGAEEAAQQWAEANGVTVAATQTEFVANNVCVDYAGQSRNLPSVTAQINNPGGSLFASLFGIDGLQDLGATATACVGMPTGLEGLDPYYISPGAENDSCFEDETAVRPIIGTECIFKTGAQMNDAGNRGNINLVDGITCSSNSGANLPSDVVHGSDAICEVGDLVYGNPGVSSGNNFAQLNCRLDGVSCPGVSGTPPGEGFCHRAFTDPNGSIPPFTGNLTATTGTHPVDDFTEVFSRPDGSRPGPGWAGTGEPLLIPNVCENGLISPRIFMVAILNPPPGPGANPGVLQEFAVFYVFGCVELNNEGDVVGDIDVKCATISGGHAGIAGMFVKAVLPEGGGELIEPEEGASLTIQLYR